LERTGEDIGGVTGRAAPEKGDEGAEGEKGTLIKERHWRGKEACKEAWTKRKAERAP